MNLAGVNEIAATIDQTSGARKDLARPRGSPLTGPLSSALLDVLLEGDPN